MPHKAICTSNGDETGVALHGIARSVTAASVRERYAKVLTPVWEGRRFQLSAVDIIGASLVRYRDSRQELLAWPSETRLSRRH